MQTRYQLRHSPAAPPIEWNGDSIPVLGPCVVRDQDTARLCGPSLIASEDMTGRDGHRSQAATATAPRVLPGDGWLKSSAAAKHRTPS